jgi:single-strand DNA-binding protein
MAGETIITVIGNLTNDPELRFTPGGDAVANFTIASTPRTFDRNSNEWKDGDPLFLRSSLWREAAQNAAETLTKGMRVIASGRLKQRSFEQDGQKRTVIEFEVDEIGPSLKYANAKVNRTAKGNQPAQSQQPAQQPAQGGWGGQPSNASGWGNDNQSEVPF